MKDENVYTNGSSAAFKALQEKGLIEGKESDDSKAAEVEEGRGIRWHWACPNCKRGKNNRFDTITKYRRVCLTCEYCGKETIVITENDKEHPRARK